MSQAKAELFLRIRDYEDCGHVDVWVMRKQGLVTSWLTHGFMSRNLAEELAKLFQGAGSRVERETSPYHIEQQLVADAKAEQETFLNQQRELFDEPQE